MDERRLPIQRVWYLFVFENQIVGDVSRSSLIGIFTFWDVAISCRFLKHVAFVNGRVHALRVTQRVRRQDALSCLRILFISNKAQLECRFRTYRVHSTTLRAVERPVGTGQPLVTWYVGFMSLVAAEHVSSASAKLIVRVSRACDLACQPLKLLKLAETRDVACREIGTWKLEICQYKNPQHHAYNQLTFPSIPSSPTKLKHKSNGPYQANRSQVHWW